MTATQEILARHAQRSNVRAGELIEIPIDLCMGNDITAPVAINEFENAGFERVFDRDRIALILDHFTPCKDIKSAQLCKTVRDFAKKHGIRHFYEGGDAGIEHALIPELGLVKAGDVVIGADSHTCTYGALGAFSTGVGSTDLAAAMYTGTCWFKVPSAIRVTLEGELEKYVSGKDIILKLIGILGVSGANYKSIEFCGTELSEDNRLTICNMAVEAGAKNGIFACSGGEYERELKIELGKLKPMVAAPFSPENVMPVSEAGHIAINQVVIGSCTNGRISDMRTAAEILRGNHVAKGVRLIVIPATPKVYAQMLSESIAEVFLQAGAVISPPTCGPCLGGHMGVLAAGETAVSTTNRNFVGRMGDKSSRVYLSGPAVAASSAIAGELCSPEEVI